MMVLLVILSLSMLGSSSIILNSNLDMQNEEMNEFFQLELNTIIARVSLFSRGGGGG